MTATDRTVPAQALLAFCGTPSEMGHQDALAAYNEGLYGKALAILQSIRRHRSLSLDETVSYAELLSITGAVHEALTTARQIRSEHHLSPLQFCRLADVIGLSLFRLGKIDNGANEYRQAIALAAQNDEAYEECRLCIHLFRNEVRWCGPQKVLADVAHVRRKTRHAADARLSIKFHLGLTDLAAKLGLLPRARRHLEIAMTLAPNVEDQAIHGDVILGEVVLAALESDVVGALEHVRRLVPVADATKSESLQFGAVVNMAHLLVLQHRFDEAVRWTELALSKRSFGGGSAIALRNTLAMMHLSRGAVDDAAAQLEQIEANLNESETNDSWLGLEHQLYKVKWHYRTGSVATGLTIAMNGIEAMERVGARTPLERMQLLAAEGLQRVGQTSDAVALFAQVIKANPDPPLETIAECHRVAGRLTAKESAGAALRHFRTAYRIWQSVANLVERSNVEHDATEVLSVSNEELANHSNFAEAPSSDTNLRATLTADGIATLSQVGAHARVLAIEALSLLADTGTIAEGVVYQRNGHGRSLTVARYPKPGTDVDLKSANLAQIPTGAYGAEEYGVATIPTTNSVVARIALLSTERLVRHSREAAEYRQHQREQAVLWPEQPWQEALGVVCASERMHELLKTLRRAANVPLTILLTGETGVGKEVFARALHLASARKDKTFQPFNCATVPKDMLDSQLFGHRKGAFTGAHESGVGVIRAADGGTLFLDEIGEMSIEAQPKLLRFLESGDIHPLGEAKPVHVDVRIVAATNASLDQLVTEGKFREDLFYRLNVLPIHIPPLRERREEIPALVEHFVEKFSREMQKPMMRLADETLEYLLLYRWPGNVRQLANELRRIVALAEPGAILTASHLSNEITGSRRTVAVEPSEFVMRLDQPLADATNQLERAAIERALTASNGNVDQAAKTLGLSRKGLYLKRQRLGLK